MHTYIHTHIYTYMQIYTRLLEAIWAMLARTEPRGLKRSPQSLLETIWGCVGPNRAGRPQTTSTEPPGSHLGPCGLQPGREAPNGLHRASWKPFGVLWGPTGPGGPNGFHRASWRPPGALWAPAGPGGPERLIVMLVNSLARCNF